MIIDETQGDSVHTYSYSVITFNNIYSLESYNIGIILKDDAGKTIMHIPSDIRRISSCIDIKEASGLNFTLDLIRKRIEHEGHASSGIVSNAISISESRVLTTEESTDEALTTLVEEYITLKRLRDPDATRERKEYEKLSIIDGLRRKVPIDKNNAVAFRKKHPIAHKIIDVIGFDKENQPAVVAEVSSLYVEQFEQGFRDSTFVLQEARMSSSVKDSFLYVPKLKALTKSQKKHLDWAKEMSNHFKIEMMVENNEEAFLERVISAG